jgi:hypothetical protein
MKEKVAKQVIYWLSVIIIGIALGFGLQFVRAWTEPTQAPPGGNLGAPINTGSQDQTKAGGLTAASLKAGVIEGTTVKGTTQLCIGGDCRSSWPAGGGTSCGWNGEFMVVCGGRTYYYSTVYVCSNGILTKIYFIWMHC